MIPQMVQRITKQSLIVIPPLAAVTFFFTDWLFAVNLVIGGAISFFSFRTMAWAVRNFLDTQMAQALIMGISVTKILLIFVFLVILAYFHLIKAIPLLAGFTLVLAIVIKEALMVAKKASRT
ncbi:MAG: ATP synthase subunit I [Dissulfurispiraceae bacterium]